MLASSLWIPTHVTVCCLRMPFLTKRKRLLANCKAIITWLLSVSEMEQVGRGRSPRALSTIQATSSTPEQAWLSGDPAGGSKDHGRFFQANLLVAGWHVWLRIAAAESRGAQRVGRRIGCGGAGTAGGGGGRRGLRAGGARRTQLGVGLMMP